MTIAHLLEEFGRGAEHAVTSLGLTTVSPDMVEAARLEAYEEGYKAGWDDAIGANTAEHLQLAADLSQNLRDMAFTYHEAVTHVTKALGGVFDGMLTHFLPEAAQLALAPKVQEVIAALPIQSNSMPLTIAVADDNLRIMEKVAEATDHEAIEVVADGDLTAGQVSLRFGPQEVALDFDALLEELRLALAATLPNACKEAQNG